MQASSKSFSSPFPSPPPRLLYKIQVSKVTDRQRHGNAEIIDAPIKMYVEMVEEGNKKCSRPDLMEFPLFVVLPSKFKMLHFGSFL